MSKESRERWIEARERFLDLADLEPEERRPRLAALAVEDPDLGAWVKRLLEQDLGTEEEPALLASSSQRFGPYESVRRIAVGGMGEVHLARRTDGEFDREVAIKCLQPGREGEQLVDRFLRERQLLAQLDHEFIARLLDGGTTERGLPYLVLEYVEGRHIDAHCRALELDLEQRLRLFLKVLQAVRHAHERGIVHRDLKPSNILIRPDGAPRLLDFGISRGSETDGPGPFNLTQTGQRLFTPEFASPEQIRGEVVTTASDVFSLGVVLYALIADVGPWQGSDSLHELERQILEDSPVPPSRRRRETGGRSLSADLDTIVLACLEKEADRRLPSVQALADELQRTLDGFPILTRPTRAPARALRYARRNPWQSLAAAAVALAFVAGAVAWRLDAASSAQEATLLLDLEQRLAHASDLGIQDRYPESIPALLEVRGRLAELAPRDDLAKLELRATSSLAIAYLRTGSPRPGLEEVERGLAHSEIEAPEHVAARVELLISGATACRWLQEHARALEYAELAHALAQQHLEPGHPDRVEAYQSVAANTGDVWEPGERVELLERAVEEARSSGEEHDSALGDALVFCGQLQTESEEYEAAVESFDEALGIERWNHGEGHGNVALVRAARGNCLRLLGRSEAALEDLQAALATFEAGGHDEMVAPTLQHLGMLRLATEDYELALEDFASARVLYSELYGNKLPIGSWLLAQMGQCLHGLELLDDARLAFEEAFAASPGVAFHGWKVESELRYAYGCLLQELGDAPGARAQLAAVQRVWSAEYGAEDERTVEVVERLNELGS